MSSSYWVGVVAAVAAGMAFNLALLIQKLAVRKTDSGAGLMRQLLRSPLWLAGFTVQFVIGVPLNILAQAKIGPTILPGLMAIGLIVLAIGASKLADERLRSGEVIGIVLVMAAVTAFGMSRLSVDVRSIDLYEPAFLQRLSIFTAAVAMLSLACYLGQKRSMRAKGIFKTLNAGLMYSQSNLWLGILMALLARWGSGAFSALDLPYILIASGIVAAGSLLGISETQGALRLGDVSKLIPMQHVPSQILPIAAYFIVFSRRLDASLSLLLALLGIVFVIAGAFLLARRQLASQEGA